MDAKKNGDFNQMPDPKKQDCGCGGGRKHCVSRKKGKGVLQSQDFQEAVAIQKDLYDKGDVKAAEKMGKALEKEVVSEMKAEPQQGAGKKRDAAYMVKLYKQTFPKNTRKGEHLKCHMVAFAQKCLNEWDCGCGCSGTKKLKKLSGGKLKDCPPGYSKFGELLCKKDCPPGMRDDGQACRGCPPGWTDTGVSCFTRNGSDLAWNWDSQEQTVIWKDTIERIDWEGTAADMKQGFEELFAKDGPLANAFDPERNGVGEAFRKFGANTQEAFEDLGAKMEKAFDPNQNGVADAFKDLGEQLGNTLGDAGWWEKTMTDPDTWIMIVGIIAGIAATALTGGAAGPGVIMALNALGPAATIVGDLAQGRPVNLIDVAALGMAFVPIPGAAGAAASAGKEVAEKAAAVAVKEATEVAIKKTAAQRASMLGKTLVEATEAAAKKTGKVISENVAKVVKVVKNPREAAEMVAKKAGKDWDAFMALPPKERLNVAARAGLKQAKKNGVVVPVDFSDPDQVMEFEIAAPTEEGGQEEMLMSAKDYFEQTYGASPEDSLRSIDADRSWADNLAARAGVPVSQVFADLDAWMVEKRQYVPPTPVEKMLPTAEKFERTYGVTAQSALASIDANPAQADNLAARAGVPRSQVFADLDAWLIEKRQYVPPAQSGGRRRRRKYGGDINGMGDEALAYIGIDDSMLGSGKGKTWESMYDQSQADIHRMKVAMVHRRADQRTVKIRPYTERPELLSDTFKEGPYGRDIHGQIAGGRKRKQKGLTGSLDISASQAKRFLEAAQHIRKGKSGGAWFSPSTWTLESVNPVNWSKEDWTDLAKGADAALFGALAEPHLLAAAEAALVAGGTFAVPGVGTVAGKTLAMVLTGAVVAHEYLYPGCDGGKKEGVLGCNEYRDDLKGVMSAAAGVAKMRKDAADKEAGERLAAEMADAADEDPTATGSGGFRTALTRGTPDPSQEFYYPESSNREARGETMAGAEYSARPVPSTLSRVGTF